jgi:hypothetical protein
MFNGQQYTGHNPDGQANRLSAENNKSSKEDHLMRLYEFTDPSHYLLPETDAAKLLKLPKTVRSDDKADVAARRPKTRKPMKTM